MDIGFPVPPFLPPSLILYLLEVRKQHNLSVHALEALERVDGQEDGAWGREGGREGGRAV